jgi:hypothetical protein
MDSAVQAETMREKVQSGCFDNSDGETQQTAQHDDNQHEQAASGSTAAIRTQTFHEPEIALSEQFVP